ncbi:hypothetical protein A3C23_04550 [Candidatus Roizmanbacteria bacterium RIFCSPHIGHO2_02_FULL_37_13b]|uniref:SpoVT-AbrB domain-containing protein n=1 Tax=Candidatus Roizmanbacteria bacterium RIFCSPLOWO2_02_FULL_36_11 TaxID=1802071 RepID=A0A1F7JH88_9BACT|nr:MAG: hypothetical protein A3C23_04550 [Candidatus Roizmanbacteria bacterium RIFCSPHIGHO2_02_FULL_37_13b]OGK54978.1 MAG: hypothetical protein A3H78_00695 [Candidatus Roizmanbacteria bacterium RIFCSPLOWO2_02_FULL_36_11]
MTPPTVLPQEEWLRILTKGMITIPKSWRDQLGFKEGKMIKAKKVLDQIIIEPIEKPVRYRLYSQKELEQFIKDDTLPVNLRKKIDKKLGKNKS